MATAKYLINFLKKLPPDMEIKVLDHESLELVDLGFFFGLMRRMKPPKGVTANSDDPEVFSHRSWQFIKGLNFRDATTTEGTFPDGKPTAYQEEKIVGIASGMKPGKYATGDLQVIPRTLDSTIRLYRTDLAKNSFFSKVEERVKKQNRSEDNE